MKTDQKRRWGRSAVSTLLAILRSFTWASIFGFGATGYRPPTYLIWRTRRMLIMEKDRVTESRMYREVERIGMGLKDVQIGFRGGETRIILPGVL